MQTSKCYGKFRPVQDFLFTKLNTRQGISYETRLQTQKGPFRIHHFTDTSFHLETTLNDIWKDLSNGPPDDCSSVFLYSEKAVFEGCICLTSDSRYWL